MIDTLRLIMDWECNLNCAYCCNKIPDLRDQFRPVRLEDIDFTRYEKLAITGGEPLLRKNDAARLVLHARTAYHNFFHGIFTILNTNGLLLDKPTARSLARAGLNAINVGLHPQVNMDYVIYRCLDAVKGTGIALRFNVWEKLAGEVGEKWPEINLRPWIMDSCDRGNEDRMALVESPLWHLPGWEG